MEEISVNATKGLKKLLDKIIAKGKYTPKDFKTIVGLSKWANEL
jgi:hypothetical protein